ncbi:MAG: family 20 glycosylhydrolase, partial [Chlorobia bacterium]|nr:family 20 glycosylhydrolase [Fimbriimonadaceae bacterium]
MQLRMWMLDVAREQSPTLEDLRRYLDLTRESGYNAIGLYLEHRFAYPSTPWSHGKGCITPEMIDTLQNEYSDIQIVPFINLLGHFEGMLYTEHGKRFREEMFKGLQACPCKPEFVRLCEGLIEDTLAAFKSEIIHIGGDETSQLGACPECRAKVDSAGPSIDGKAGLYGDHFGPLARKVKEARRKPAVWGDMFLEHPAALDSMPKDTLIFDWQYFKSPLETSKQFVDKGFEVVCSPAILTYNALWCHLEQSEQNVRDHIAAAHDLNARGVCVTTWECGLFGNYETLFPVIRACGGRLGEAASQTPTPQPPPP